MRDDKVLAKNVRAFDMEPRCGPVFDGNGIGERLDFNLIGFFYLWVHRFLFCGGGFCFSKEIKDKVSRLNSGRMLTL